MLAAISCQDSHKKSSSLCKGAILRGGIWHGAENREALHLPPATVLQDSAFAKKEPQYSVAARRPESCVSCSRHSSGAGFHLAHKGDSVADTFSNGDGRE